MSASIVIAGLSLLVAPGVVAVAVGGNGGAVDVVAGGEFLDRCAGLIGGDEIVDVGRGEASRRRG